MIKLVITVYRKPGLTMEEFSDRWFNGHGPLVRRLAPALRIKRYVQSHYVSAPQLEAALAARGWATRPDGLTETYWDNIEDYYSAVATPEGIAASKELQVDEVVFCDMDRIQAFLSEERIVF